MLTVPRAVMVNRGGESLYSCRFVAKTMGWPLIGEDPEDLVLCDAGNAVVGFGFKQSQANLDSKQCCSGRFLGDVNIAANPASELELIASDFNEGIKKAAAMHDAAPAEVEGNVLEGKEGRRLSFYDIHGNLTTFSEPTKKAFSGDDGSKLRSLLKNRGFGTAGRRKPDNPAPIIGITLLVNNLQRSIKFYRDTLGLKALRTTDREVRFDAGPMIITVRVEQHIGMVRFLRKRELLRDQIMFYVPDLKAETENLTSKGVHFPNGIEGSISAGQVAYFADPDGHNLWLWQPPEKLTPEMRINFYPTLERILKEH
jgi:catechol 2,3-dioxygenase-like lactoylglutathione lyase family enzyme